MDIKNKLSTIVLPITAFLSIIVVLSLKRIQVKAEQRLQRRKKKQNAINIGAIFGMDVGGTLTKIVYFETKLEKTTNDETTATADPLIAKTLSNGAAPVKRASTDSLAQLDSPDHQAALEQLYTYMDNNTAMKDSSIVIRDSVLSVYSNVLCGRLHFLHFETRNMVQTIKYLSSNALVENITSIGCTGGGAHKYADEFQDELEITFNKFDELGCLVRGMHFALTNFKDECYTFRNVETVPDTPPATASSNDPATKPPASASAASANTTAPPSEGKSDAGNEKSVPISVRRWQKDLKEYTERVTLPYESLTTFPYLVVNIGSGVSILKVSSPGNYERVSGSSLGGGTYWGLCRLLTKCATYDEVLDVAESGDAGMVDMLVKDIYGGDYGGILSGSMVASSFGKLVMKENPREGVKEEDLALALLMMITNNIGQVAHLNAQLHNCSKIFFVGSFLRHNPISCRRLAFAIDFWSAGKMEALFLTHEGYFGALGTFLQSAFGDDVDKILSSKRYCGEQVKKTGSPSKPARKTTQDMTLDSSSNDNNDRQEEGSGGEMVSPLGKYITSQFAKWRNKSFSGSSAKDAEQRSRPASVGRAHGSDNSEASGGSGGAAVHTRKNRSSSDDHIVRSPRVSANKF